MVWCRVGASTQHDGVLPSFSLLTCETDQYCRDPTDGSPVALCLALGVTQNALIVECGGRHSRNPHCGTFLEVHRPGHAEVLADTRLPGMFTSGYRCVQAILCARLWQ